MQLIASIIQYTLVNLCITSIYKTQRPVHVPYRSWQRGRTQTRIVIVIGIRKGKREKRRKVKRKEKREKEGK